MVIKRAPFLHSISGIVDITNNSKCITLLSHAPILACLYSHEVVFVPIYNDPRISTLPTLQLPQDMDPIYISARPSKVEALFELLVVFSNGMLFVYTEAAPDRVQRYSMVDFKLDFVNMNGIDIVFGRCLDNTKSLFIYYISTNERVIIPSGGKKVDGLYLLKNHLVTVYDGSPRRVFNINTCEACDKLDSLNSLFAIKSDNGILSLKEGESTLLKIGVDGEYDTNSVSITIPWNILFVEHINGIVIVVYKNFVLLLDKLTFQIIDEVQFPDRFTPKVVTVCNDQGVVAFYNKKECVVLSHVLFQRICHTKEFIRPKQPLVSEYIVSDYNKLLKINDFVSTEVLTATYPIVQAWEFEPGIFVLLQLVEKDTYNLEVIFNGEVIFSSPCSHASISNEQIVFVKQNVAHSVTLHLNDKKEAESSPVSGVGTCTHYSGQYILSDRLVFLSGVEKRLDFSPNGMIGLNDCVLLTDVNTLWIFDEKEAGNQGFSVEFPVPIRSVHHVPETSMVLVELFCGWGFADWSEGCFKTDPLLSFESFRSKMFLAPALKGSIHDNFLFFNSTSTLPIYTACPSLNFIQDDSIACFPIDFPERFFFSCVLNNKFWILRYVDLITVNDEAIRKLAEAAKGMPVSLTDMSPENKLVLIGIMAAVGATRTLLSCINDTLVLQPFSRSIDASEDDPLPPLAHRIGTMTSTDVWMTNLDSMPCYRKLRGKKKSSPKEEISPVPEPINSVATLDIQSPDVEVSSPSPSPKNNLFKRKRDFDPELWGSSNTGGTPKLRISLKSRNDVLQEIKPLFIDGNWREMSVVALRKLKETEHSFDEMSQLRSYAMYGKVRMLISNERAESAMRVKAALFVPSLNLLKSHYRSACYEAGAFLIEIGLSGAGKALQKSKMISGRQCICPHCRQGEISMNTLKCNRCDSMLLLCHRTLLHLPNSDTSLLCESCGASFISSTGFEKCELCHNQLNLASYQDVMDKTKIK
ncbi:hypothetical protein PCE1_003204 [Barthelona sp. PCE]